MASDQEFKQHMANIKNTGWYNVFAGVTELAYRHRMEAAPNANLDSSLVREIPQISLETLRKNLKEDVIRLANDPHNVVERPHALNLSYEAIGALRALRMIIHEMLKSEDRASFNPALKAALHRLGTVMNPTHPWVQETTAEAAKDKKGDCPIFAQSYQTQLTHLTIAPNSYVATAECLASQPRTQYYEHGYDDEMADLIGDGYEDSEEEEEDEQST